MYKRDKKGRFIKGTPQPKGIKKGHIPWNKDKHTGLIPRSAFKKGHKSWNKGNHMYLGGKRFEKGHIPWLKGKHPEYLQGKNHPNWTGGKIIHGGYVYLLKPNHPFCNFGGYVRHSRLVMEKSIGRYLKCEEVVHHLNRKKTDDRLQNLKLFKNHSAHIKFHWNKI